MSLKGILVRSEGLFILYSSVYFIYYTMFLAPSTFHNEKAKSPIELIHMLLFQISFILSNSV